MPIVSSVVALDHPESDGRRYLQYEHTDEFGTRYRTGLRLVPAAYVADAPADAVELEAALDEDECEEAISRVEAGEDSLAVSDAFRWSSKQKIARKLVRYMIRQRDPYLVLAMEPLIEWIKANFTASQIRTYLEISVAQLQTLNSKYDSIIAAKAELLAADIEEDWG